MISATRRRPKPRLTVLITRPRAQAKSLAEGVRRLGFRPILAPAIRVAPPRSWRALDKALGRLETYDAIVFTSVNGVELFFKRAAAREGGRPKLPARLFAIGPATAAALRRRGSPGASVPSEYEGEALARHLLKKLGQAKGRRVLLPRARVARDALPRMLKAAGVAIDVVEAYRTVPDLRGRRALKRAVLGGNVSVVTFTSPSTVHQFVGAVGLTAARKFLMGAAAASIGPVTSAALRGYGMRPKVEARPFNVEGLLLALKRLPGESE